MIDHLLRAHRLVCPGRLTDSRTAPGSVILPTTFFISRPSAPQHRTRRRQMPYETTNRTEVAPDSFTMDAHAAAPHFSSLTFLSAFQHLLGRRIA
jgi:hypothetical protein